MRKFGQLKATSRHIEDVGVDVNVVYPKWINIKDLLELDFRAPEI